MRKLQDGEFCSDKHRSAYSQSSEQLALSRLFEQPAAPPAKQNPFKPSPSKGAKRPARDETPFAALVKPKTAFGPAEIGLFRMHPEDEDFRVRPIDGPTELARPQLPAVARHTQVPRAESLANPASIVGEIARQMAASQRQVDPGFEAEFRTPGFERSGSGQLVHLTDLVALACKIELPWIWTPRDECGLAFLRPDVTPYRRQTHYRLPRLACPVMPAGLGADGVEVERGAQISNGLVQRSSAEVPEFGRLVAEGAARGLGRGMAGVPGRLTDCLLNLISPVKVVRGIGVGRAQMPAGTSIDLRPFERVHGNRRPIAVVEGWYLGTSLRAFPSMDALLGRRNLAGAPRVPIALPAAKNSTVAVSTAESDRLEEISGIIALPAGCSIAGPVFRAPLASLRQLALASRNPLKHRTNWQDTPAEESLGAPAQVTPKCAFAPEYTAVPRTAEILSLTAPTTVRLNRTTDGKNQSKVFEAEWPGVPAPAGEPQMAARQAHERMPALSKTLYSINLDQINPKALPSTPKGQWEPEFTPPLVILSSARLALREERESLLTGDKSYVASIFEGPLAVAGAVWQRAAQVPKWATAAVMTLVMSVGLLSVVPSAQGTPDSADLSAWAKLQRTIMDRAAIALTDDFRTGLASWEGDGDWAKSWSYDSTGFVRTGALALYAPTIELQDYRVEFLAQIEKKALSWVVRAADLENYQVVKLVLSDSGPLPKADIVRYTVIDGKRGKETRKALPMSVTRDTIYRVSLEVRKDDVVLAMQGTVVDTWAEPRLARGGIGFFSGPGEKARLRWVGVWHQYDTLGRLCAYLSPYSMPDRERSMGQ